MLYGRSLLVIYFIYGGVYVLIPNSQFIRLPKEWGTDIGTDRCHFRGALKSSGTPSFVSHCREEFSESKVGNKKWLIRIAREAFMRVGEKCHALRTYWVLTIDHSPFTPPPASGKPLVYTPSVWFCLFWTFCINGIIICDLLSCLFH